MYSILIVEDERWEREGLVDFLDWNAMGITIAGTAVDGIEGYEKAMELAPDIIVTDIRMPGMNGLEMAQKIHERLPDVRIVFLTGYSDFEYTREAISLHADDYVLKPVEEEEMRTSMLRVLKMCEQIRARRREEMHIQRRLRSGERMEVEKLLLNLLTGRGNPEQVIAQLSVKEVELCSKPLGVMVIVPPTPLPDEEIRRLFNKSGYLVLCDSIAGAVTAVVPLTEQAASDDTSRIAEQLLGLWKALSPLPLTIGTGNSAPGLLHSGTAYRQALNAAQYGVFYGITGVVTSEMEAEARDSYAERSYAFLTAWQEASRQLRLHMLALQGTAIHKELDRMFASIRSHTGAGKHYIATLLNGLIIDLSMIEDNRGGDKGRIQELLGMNRLGEMCGYVKDYVDGLFARLETRRIHKTDYIVEKTIRLIEEKIGSNDLSLSMLADEVFVSPNHLGVLFKKTNGKTVHQYIMETRMRKSEELLRMTKLKVSEVAERVGMINISYFCSVFKQYYGVSPGEFQETMLRR
jgi:two-component system response regulator YesN